MTKENEFSKTFEEWYEDWFKKPFPTDKEKELKADYDLQSVYEYCCKRQISVEDEELAKEYRKSLKQRLIDEDDFERLEKFDENVEEAFLAGLKAGRPQWHKVADGDLPKVSCLVFYKDTSGVNSYSIVHPSWYIAGIKAFFENNPRIIAWCEIPTFDKE